MASATLGHARSLAPRAPVARGAAAGGPVLDPGAPGRSARARCGHGVHWRRRRDGACRGPGMARRMGRARAALVHGGGTRSEAGRVAARGTAGTNERARAQEADTLAELCCGWARSRCAVCLRHRGDAGVGAWVRGWLWGLFPLPRRACLPSLLGPGRARSSAG